MILQHERVSGRSARPEQMAAAGPEYRRSVARMEIDSRRRAERRSAGGFGAGFLPALQRHPALVLGGLALGALWLFSGRGKGFSWDGGRSRQTPAPRAPRAMSGGQPGVGLSSGLQPGGTIPGRSPALGMGSIGTGGGSTGSDATGNVGRMS